MANTDTTAENGLVGFSLGEHPQAEALVYEIRQKLEPETRPSDNLHRVGKTRYDARSAVPPPENRQHAWYFVSHSALLVPILPDEQPDRDRRADGTAVDLSVGGVGLLVDAEDSFARGLALVGVEDDEGSYHFATVDVRHKRAEASGLYLGCRFVSPEEDPLREENLIATFHPVMCQYAVNLSALALQAWTSLGVTQPILVDRVRSCPECSAIASFRKGCQVCGSARVEGCRFIHHFACAYVGPVTEFERGDSLVCPKCHAKNLIVGSDFEHLNGPYRCHDCDWSDTELDLVGQCLYCRLRFPGHRAVEKEVIQYHVRRLDPLAFIGSS